MDLQGRCILLSADNFYLNKEIKQLSAHTTTLKLPYRWREPSRNPRRIWPGRWCIWSRGSAPQWQGSRTSRCPGSTAAASRGRWGRSAGGNLDPVAASSPRTPSGTQWEGWLQGHKTSARVSLDMYLYILFIVYIPVYTLTCVNTCFF